MALIFSKDGDCYPPEIRTHSPGWGPMPFKDGNRYSPPKGLIIRVETDTFLCVCVCVWGGGGGREGWIGEGGWEEV